MNSGLGTFFKVLAYLEWIIGGIAVFSVMIATKGGKHGYILTLIIYLVAVIISGMFLYAFGEILSALYRIENKLKDTSSTPSVNSSTSEPEETKEIAFNSDESKTAPVVIGVVIFVVALLITLFFLSR